jgi:hypothetical protein
MINVRMVVFCFLISVAYAFVWEGLGGIPLQPRRC